jgi:hypothetical protein
VYRSCRTNADAQIATLAFLKIYLRFLCHI